MIDHADPQMLDSPVSSEPDALPFQSMERLPKHEYVGPSDVLRAASLSIRMFDPSLRSKAFKKHVADFPQPTTLLSPYMQKVKAFYTAVRKFLHKNRCNLQKHPSDHIV